MEQFANKCALYFYSLTYLISAMKCSVSVHAGRYLGDQRFSYGLDLTFTLRVGEEGARASVDDIIIEGDGRRISAPIFSQDNEVIQI